MDQPVQVKGGGGGGGGLNTTVSLHYTKLES